MTDDKIAGDVAPPAQAPPLSPVERIAKLIEVLYLRESGFTGELLGELDKCDPADLVRLFGRPIRSPRPRATSPEAPAPQAADQQIATAGALSVDEADPAALRPPIVEPPGVTLLNAYPAEPQWDEHGYRIGAPNCQRRFRAVTSRRAHVAPIGRAEIPGVLLS
jgi:hypothetical protein